MCCGTAAFFLLGGFVFLLGKNVGVGFCAQTCWISRTKTDNDGQALCLFSQSEPPQSKAAQRIKCSMSSFLLIHIFFRQCT